MGKILRFLKPYRGAVILAVSFVLLQSISDLTLPTLMARIVDRGIANGDNALILRVGSFMLLVAFCGATAAIFGAYFTARTSSAFARDVRSRVFSKVESFSLHEFDAIGTSTLITRTTNDVTQLQNFIQMGLHMLSRAPLMATGSIVLALSTDARLSMVLLVALPIQLAIIALVAIRGLPLFKKMQAKVDGVNRVLREGLTGIRVVRAFNREAAETRRFAAANHDLADTALKAQRIMLGLMPILTLGMNFTTIAVVWFGSVRVDAGAIQVGNLMAFIQYAMHVLFSFMILSNMFVMLPRASVSADRIVAVLETKAEITDPEQASKGKVSRDLVEFRDVTFRYPGAEECALRDVSFIARKGETTAIIGGTGSGKSTLISLLPRFYDVEGGAVLVDGVDVRRMSQADLRSKIGFVPQKAVLFTGSVADNIRYGADDAKDEDVRRAAEIAQAADFVEELPNGYQTAVAQGGANLSGGQKQRLSIARALVRRPEIYVFDDSFSALDFRTDAKLRAALSAETEGAAVIIVAQRVGTVMNADQIVVLDEGRVVGIGTHRELLDSCAVYREIVASQFSMEESA